MTEESIIHFQSRDYKILFRDQVSDGVHTYTMEMEDRVFAKLTNPGIGFEAWTHLRVERLLNPTKNTVLDRSVSPVGRTDNETLHYENRVHRNINR